MNFLTDDRRRRITAAASVCRCGRPLDRHSRRVVPNAGIREYVCQATESGRLESATLPHAHYDPEAGLVVERYANGLEVAPELRRAAVADDDPYQTGDDTKPCPDCGGQGMVNRSHDPQTAENCPTCGGEGYVDADYEEDA